MSDTELYNDPSLESLIADVADEFTERLGRGERVDAEEYARRHPAIADVIRRVLPALQVMRLSGSGPVPTVAMKSVSSDSVDDSVASPVGTLGDYRLIREVGRGGMGVVYEALQISLGRKVALKVLPFAAALDSKQLQRFKTEAQAAAHLHHPSIVPVYGIGCERGVHYYAMQFIEGQSLDAMLDELRRDRAGEATARPATAGEPTAHQSGSLAATIRSTSSPAYFRMVSQWGIQAAEALEHAHQFGVVHRDIKPGNLIVDTQGHLWITDFGLARCQSEAGLTVTGDLVGTFRYMSPEQALGRRAELNQGTDIYALGATLYELLTLEPVFAGNDRQEILQRIAFEDPRPPRRLRKEIPTELETILLKALEKQRDCRYATAGEMAEDLRRFLDDRPILARKPNIIEKAGKWARRHRVVVVSAVALLLLAVVGLTISTVLISGAQARTQAAYALLAQEQSRTREAYELEAQQRSQAETNFRQAWQAVDFFAHLSESELRDHPEKRRKFLEAALQYYQAFIEQQGGDSSIRAELELSHMHVAQILKEIGSPADAQAATKFLQGGDFLRLLSHEAVQKDLLLTREQTTKITQQLDRRSDLFRDYRGWTAEDWLARSQKLATFDRAALAILNTGQMKRLQQIALQQQGVQAFLEPEIADTLQLSTEQRDKLRAMSDEIRRLTQEDFRRNMGPPGPGPGRRGGFGPGGGWRRPDLEPAGPMRTEDALKILKEQAMATLTPAQKARWNEMIGEPFVGETRHGGPGGPGPGGPGFGGPRPPFGG
jgi:eukaryotic-like serine/threonine-protein kinase